MDESKDTADDIDARVSPASGMGNGGGVNGQQQLQQQRGNNSGGGGGAHYSIPGILHFLQHEWSRFEMERSQWEVEKAELQARIAFLQGERKGQENLKNDLVRRIKMLEYALKQERAKYNKLRYGSDGVGGGLDAAGGKGTGAEEDGVEMPPIDGENFIAVSNVNWRQGRQLLRQYLQEIGYTDTIIDVRSNRVRSLLGLSDNGGGGHDVNEENNRTNLAMNGDGGGSSAAARRQQQQDGQQQQTNRRGVATTLAEEMMIDTEAAVMANFDFLATEAEVDDDDDDDGDDGYNPSEMKLKASKLAQAVAASDTADTEEVLNEFSFLNNPDSVDSIKSIKDDDADSFVAGTNDIDNLVADFGIDEVERLQELYSGNHKRKRSKGGDFMGGLSGGGHYSSGGGGNRQQSNVSAGVSAPTASAVSSSSPGGGSGVGDKGNELGGNLELGELEQLTITNENESAYDQITAPKEAFRKTWTAKYTLRSHFDGVRALRFHPTEPALITASEDQTLKLWNLQKTMPAKKSASLDVEPVYTFRAHQGPVLSLAVSPTGDFIFSGGLDATIRSWAMPPPSVDPYDTFEPAILASTLTGHCDAVWGLSYHGPKQHLLSCSADGTVKLWRPSNRSQPLLKTFGGGAVEGAGKVPTSADWVYADPAHLVAAYSDASCFIYDIESGKPVVKLDMDSSEMGPVTKVVSHPTLPLTITAHEDRHIRFFDNSTGKLTHAMVAHLDAVTSLAVDANGLYLISGSHDCSVRLWNLETKTCVQEITAHRKKFDESIFDVAFHPTKPFIASAGADALAKVFV